jgi:hypothetical protein
MGRTARLQAAVPTSAVAESGRPVESGTADAAWRAAASRWPDPLDRLEAADAEAGTRPADGLLGACGECKTDPPPETSLVTAESRGGSTAHTLVAGSTQLSARAKTRVVKEAGGRIGSGARRPGPLRHREVRGQGRSFSLARSAKSARAARILDTSRAEAIVSPQDTVRFT